MTSLMHPAILVKVRIAMLVIHHMFFNLSNHLILYINNEFKGSCAAENFSCGHTKTAAIASCVGDQFQLDLITDLKKLPFSLVLDESKFPLTVCIFDINHQRIMKKIFDMNLMKGWDASTAAEMFPSVDKLFIKYDISWDFITGLGIDNTNANIGEHNSVKSRAIEKNHNIFIAGWPCHILHNAACKSDLGFATITGFDIEDHCVDILLVW